MFFIYSKFSGELLRRSLGQWNAEEHRGALALAAFDADVAAVGLHQAADDGQPQAGAAVVSAVGLPEAIEQVRDVLGRNPRPAVANAELALINPVSDVSWNPYQPVSPVKAKVVSAVK